MNRKSKLRQAMFAKLYGTGYKTLHAYYGVSKRRVKQALKLLRAAQ